MLHVPATLPNPLHHLHAIAPAEFQPYADIDIVSTFGLPQLEYSAIRKACGLMDLPQRGILELAGKDRLSFLNSLLTNQTWNKDSASGLTAGQGAYAFFLNGKGRIVTDVNVLELGDRTLLEMDGRMVEPVRQMLDKYIFREDVRMTDRVGTLYEIALHGPGGKAVLQHIAASVPGELAPLASCAAAIWGIPAVVWRDDATAAPGYHLVLPLQEVAAVWTRLVGEFADRPDPANRLLRPVGWAAFNATRIEAGRPIFAIDFTDAILPAETGQFDRAVSLTKGCYLGQEIVARMHARGQLAKRLAGIRMENDALPIAGAPIHDAAANQIGAVTSSTLSPVLSNTAICLGYLKKPFFAEGTEVTIPAEGAMHKGRVVKTPFV
jgi:aminomethyltransferase